MPESFETRVGRRYYERDVPGLDGGGTGLPRASCPL